MRPATSNSSRATEKGNEVLDAAAAVFARQGFRGTSIDDVADELGATKGRVYHYYRSKAELLVGVLTYGMTSLLEEIEPIALSPAPADDRLFEMARKHATLMMSEQPYQLAVLRSLEENSLSSQILGDEQWSNVRKLRRAYEALFRGVVAEVFEERGTTDFDVAIVTRGLIGTVNWLSVWYRPAPAGGQAVPADEIATTLARLVVAGAHL